MARGQIEESLRTKMASIKVFITNVFAFTHNPSFIRWLTFLLFLLIYIKIKERMVQLQDAPKGASVTSEATERELELEAQLVEARSIIQEQVLFVFSSAIYFLPTFMICFGVSLTDKIYMIISQFYCRSA